MTLYAATSNASKLAEFQAAADGTGISVEPLPGFDALPRCVEDGATFEENARKKAEHYSRLAQALPPDALVLAEDSGLEVEALGGAPGVHSARYTGPDATTESNNRKLLREMARLPTAERQARFVCVIALARGGEMVRTCEGRVDGLIAFEPAGAAGFGYDPIFLLPDLGRTFAELAREEKLRYSHRGRAFWAMVEWLRRSGTDLRARFERA